MKQFRLFSKQNIANVWDKSFLVPNEEERWYGTNELIET